MNITLSKLGPLLLLAGAQVVAQNDLRLVRPDGTTTTIAYSDGHSVVSIRYDALPNETTLLFAHTTLDVLPLTDVENPEPTISESLAKGITELYQFLQVPVYWVAADLTPMSGGLYSVTTPSMPVAIPAGRLDRHLTKFLQSDHSGFGTQGGGSVTFVPQAGWLALPAHDERRTWSAQPPVDPEDLAKLDVVDVGRASIFQQAADQANQMLVVPNEEALNLLSDIMRLSIGFRIHVQAIHVDLTQQPPPIRFSQVAVIRVRSLKEAEALALPANEMLAWNLDGGLPRCVPWLLGGPNETMYLGGLGEYITLRFPNEVTGLMAQIPLSGGGYTTVQQLPSEVSQDQRIAMFPYPSNATTGLVLVGHVAISGNAASWVQDIPDGHLGGLAMVWAYDPNLYGWTWNPDWWNLNR